MRPRAGNAALITLLLFGCCMAASAHAQRHPTPKRETWHEFLMKKLNPRDIDYGTRIKKRRQAFLQAIAQPHFWYCVSLTAGMLLILLAYMKLYLDSRRRMRITSLMMADIYTHDLYSRKAANEAIRKYNQHMEQCNREIEAENFGNGRPGWRNLASANLQADVQHLAAQLEAMTQERNKLQEELREKAAIIADLSARLGNIAKKRTSAAGDAGQAPEPSRRLNGEAARFISQINRLQEELYVERQRNKRLKGA